MWYVRASKKYVLVANLMISFWLLTNPALAKKDLSHKDRIQSFYDHHERQCVQKGWNKITVNINGIERKILWKGPEQAWEKGVIIVLHGGGGTYSNFCSNIPIGEPMGEFSELAIKEGFAVFSLDSTNGLTTDVKGCSCGKRFDCLAQDYRDNIDLPFIKAVITEVIPELRPAGSAEEIFMAGISNGGFTTILAATHFDDKITAFAVVSGGDPYGTYIDCDPDLTQRKNAPGIFCDSETNKNIGEDDSCRADVYLHEKEWQTSSPVNKPSFKQFHHEGDSGVDISCMKKVQKLLSQHGYKDDGSYIIKNTGPKKAWKHFWMREYNQPIIDFFKKFTAK